jgi:hypothetical protein
VQHTQAAPDFWQAVQLLTCLNPSCSPPCLQEVIALYDNQPRVPLVIIGYQMLTRSMSVRSDLRVPTHMLLAPAPGIALNELVQMAGRGMGRNRDVHERYGCDQVTVLCTKRDFRYISGYDGFVQELYQQVQPGQVRRTFEVPEQFRHMARVKREQGGRLVSRRHFHRGLEGLIRFRRAQGAGQQQGGQQGKATEQQRE